MKLKNENLKRLLSPRHIAFIGHEQVIRNGIRNCNKIGFSGDIYVVNHSSKEIENYPCYKSVKDLPLAIDAAFIAVRGERTITTVKELVEIGTSGCVCYAAGFSETGNEQLQRKLVKVAGDMALVGPNCFGVLNFLDNVPLWPDRYGGKSTDRGVAIISQSGNISLNMTMADRSLPVSYVISVGNQAVLGIGDYIEALCEDPRVSAIGLHIEGTEDMNAFSRAAQIANEKGVPLVALKIGSSEMGSQLTMSHTSSLAGSDELYQALFNRMNICRVGSLSELVETLKLFHVSGSWEGRKLGVLTCSGGESAIAADLVAKTGFALPELNKEQTIQLQAQLSQFEHITNPLDYNTSLWGNEAKLEKCFTTFMSGDFDAILLIIDLLDADSGDVEPWEISIKALMNAYRHHPIPTVVVSTLPEGLPAPIRTMLINAGITPLQGINDAFVAMNKVTAYRAKKNKQDLLQKPIDSTLLLPDYSINQASAYTLSEWEGKQELATYGLKIPKGILVSKGESCKIVKEMEGPFVVKGVSNRIAHKTDIGAVLLNLKNEEEVVEAIDKIDRNLVAIPDEEKMFLIEEMVQHAVAELTIGLKRDRQFGLALVIGIGGELVNLLNDSVSLLLPTTDEAIAEALSTIKGIHLLEGFRGRSKGDMKAVIEAAMMVADYAADHKNSILELDVNPLLVLPEGKGAVVVDAFIRLASTEKEITI